MSYFKVDKAESPKNIIGTGTTMIANGTQCTGDISSSNDLRIDGIVVGNIHCQSKVVVGQNGAVTGNIYCGQSDISGEVTGDVDASDSIFLRSQARVTGNIQSKVLQMESGVTFNGQCRMGASNASPVLEKKAAETVSFVSDHVN